LADERFDEKLSEVPFPNIDERGKVVVIGNYGGGNLGDEAMLDVLVELILQRLGKIKIVVPSRRPDMIRSLHPNPLVYPVTKMQGVLQALLCGTLIVGGGTIFSTFSGPGVMTTTIIAIIRKILLRKKVYFYGIGYSSSTSHFLSILAKLAFKLADGIYVRDSISQETLSRILKRKLVLQIPELGLFLKRGSSLPDELVYMAKNRQGPLVGISLMHIAWLDYDQIIDSIKGFMEYLYSKHNAIFCFLTFQPRVIDYYDAWRSDEEIGQMIVDRLPEQIRANCRVLGACSGSDTLRIIDEVESIISMRYHCLVFAYAQGKPYVAISFEDKHRAFVKDYGGVSIPLANISATNIIEKWEELRSRSNSHLPQSDRNI
jgi:polysaccharide pyruvyl transferase WcaK-like protein